MFDVIYTEKLNISLLCNTDENGQRFSTRFKTVGCVYDRYRLVHRWVPEMVLNVQSEFLLLSKVLNALCLFYRVKNRE